MFQLKKYQQQTLEALANFLGDVSSMPVEEAFAKSQRELERPAIPYRHYDFGQLPYVCLRLPTGGGKTVLASHAIGVAKRQYLQQDYPIVLWLVPTTTIRQQTLEALKTPKHPYRQELENEFGPDRLRILDIGEVTQIRPQDIGRKAIIVVGTLASLRVDDTSGRKVYAYHEDFEPHFAGIKNDDERLERVQESDLSENGLGPETVGKVKYSFANILALRQPLVIMDEAHNARTPLSYEVIKRIHPACVIELTATPDDSSNVLYSVSATALKAEQMIKLPVMLTEHTEGWQSAVRDAHLTRERLALEAQKDRDYIRPIVLYQADTKNGEVAVDVLKQYLLDELHIPEQEIAIATGEQRELDGLDLQARDCPVKYIITIEALKEGWDCPFAYVFCSVRDMSSNRAVEQLLGRVLRMPYAQNRFSDALNRAYAHLTSKTFAEAARKLGERLVDMGFEKLDLAAYLQAGYSQPLFDDQGNIQPREEPPLFLELPQTPDLNSVLPEERGGLNILEMRADGSCRVEVKGPVPEKVEKLLLKGITGAAKRDLQANIQDHNLRDQVNKAPSVRGEKFPAFPRLCLYEQEELELLDCHDFLYVKGEWSLLDYGIELPGLTLNETTNSFELDVDEAGVTSKIAYPSASYNLSLIEGRFTEQDLVRWLERECRQADIVPTELRSWLVKLISYLFGERGFTLTALERGKFILARAIQKRIKLLRQQAADKGFQQLLFDEPERLTTSYEFGYPFNANAYPANRLYSGKWKFNKHFYPLPGELKSEGEEFECAVQIDRHPRVNYWVRNLERREAASFSLPLAGRNFYPDFVAELDDGRLLVVEYKGEVYKTNDDSREKKLAGDCWARQSDGKCIFLFAVKDDNGRDIYQQMDEAIGH